MSRCDTCGKFSSRLYDVWATAAEPSIERAVCGRCVARLEAEQAAVDLTAARGADLDPAVVERAARAHEVSLRGGVDMPDAVWARQRDRYGLLVAMTAALVAAREGDPLRPADPHAECAPEQ